MLSWPITVAVPATCDAFLIKLVDRFSLSFLAVEPLAQSISALGVSCLWALPRGMLDSLQDKLIAGLRHLDSATASENLCKILILAKMKAYVGTSSSSTVDHLLTRRNR